MPRTFSEPEPEPELVRQADDVEALFAEFAREDAAAAAAKQAARSTGDDAEDAVIGFIADSIVAFDDELEALRQGGPGALREHALQEALSDCQKNDRQLRLQELRLRRFCERAGASLDAPDKQLAECLGMLERRGQQQQNELRESEALEYKLLLSRREAELAEALQRVEAAELALQVERDAHDRTKAAARTAVAQPSRAASVGNLSTDFAESVSEPAGPLPTIVQEDDSPRAVVERLRVEKLVGGSSDPAIKSLQATLGRALERLSRDLYSSSAHFFSEVVQNCDDNDYPDGVIPTLRVVHTPSAICISNNETGFSAADVAGLCDIGAGTKAHDGVRIGRKGIGFKSVFMVTDCPHICSGGFCWRFDTAAYGLFGYIVPEWVEREVLEAALPDSFDLPQPARPGTVIWLPLKADEPAGDIVDVAVQIEPAALLFLRRLRDIQLEDRRGRTVISTRLTVETISDARAQRLCGGAHDARVSVKRLRRLVDGSEDKTVEYILFTERLKVPPGVVSRESCDHCEGDVMQLVLAFPLVDEPDPQSIFAFLPVCPSNFSFIICADWDLTSSRQSVHYDSALNLWLRDHVALVFGQAVASVPMIRENIGRYLPVEDTSSALFWAPVATQLRTVLRDQACIFTEGGSWRKPQEVLLRVAECPAELISNKWLYTCCGKEFISETQLKSIGSEKAAELGCRSFEFYDLTSCFQRAEFIDQLHAAPDSYFERLYCYLHAVVGLDGSNDLFSLPIFRIHQPNADGILVSALASLADGKVFLSIPKSWYDVLYTRAVRVLCNTPSSVAAQQFCRSVNVLPATLADVLDSIQEQHLSAAFQNRTELWSGLQFLKDHIHELEPLEADGNHHTSDCKRRLQLSLCAPAYCGALMSLSDLSVPCFMGVPCPICFPEENRSVPTDLKPKLLPVHIIAPASATYTMDVTTRITQETGAAATIVTHLSTRDKHKSFDQAATASEGTARGKVRYDATILTDGVGIGFVTASACGMAKSYLSNPSPRQGSVVMFGDGGIWLGSERAQGSQRFGPGDIITVATDAAEGLIFLAVNGVLVDGPQIIHDSPAMPGRPHRAGLQITREMIGDKLLPIIVLNGAECEVSFGADLPVADLPDCVPLAAYQASNIKSRCSNEELSIDLTNVQSDLGMLTTEKRLGWEAFFLSMGAAPHLCTCAEPSFWNGHDGKCPICLLAFVPSNPAVQIATCQHRFHGSCIQEWLSRKQTCPVCRGAAQPATLEPTQPKGPVGLSSSVEETLGKVVLMPPTSSGRKLLLQALNTYSSRSLTAEILMSTSVPTTQGLVPLDEAFVDSTYSRFAGQHLPYLSISRVIPPDLASVLAALGVASVLDTRGVLKAIVLLGQLCRTNDGPQENSRLDLFAGLYGVLDGILRDEDGRSARIAAVRKCFRESAIIFAQGSLLCRSGEALWEGNFEIATWLRRPVIGQLYPSLRLFFEDVLQIQSLGMEHCIFTLRCMARQDFRIARLGNCSLLTAARVALREVEKFLVQAKEHGCDDDDSLSIHLANFPLLSDGIHLTDHLQSPDHAIRCSEDSICLICDETVASDFPKCLNRGACVYCVEFRISS